MATDPATLASQQNQNNTNDLNTYNSAYSGGLQSLLGGQEQQNNDLLNQYKSTIGNQESQSSIASRMGNELGLPALQQSANVANQAVADLPNNQLSFAKYGSGISQAGGQFTNSQLQQLISQKLGELSPIAQRATSQLQNAQNTLNTQMGYASSDQQKALLPFQMQQQMLSDQQTRAMTGFSQQKQSQLDGLMQKMQMGQALTSAEMQQAYTLAQQENDFQHQSSLQGQSAANSQALARLNNNLQYTVPPKAYQDAMTQYYNNLYSGSGGTTNPPSTAPTTPGYTPLTLNNSFNGGLSFGR